MVETKQEIKSQKQELRDSAKAKLQELIANRESFYARQQKLIQAIELSPEFKKAKTILTYYPMEDEYDLTSLVISNPDKTWVLPGPIGDSRMVLFEAGDMFDLIDARYGTKAPPATNRMIRVDELDLVIVPALGYDKDGYRLGRGGGYYDRLLSKVNKSCKSIGICFSELIMDSLPRDKHDISVSKVLDS